MPTDIGFTRPVKPSAPEPPAPLENWQENGAICPPGLHLLMPLDRIFVDRNPEGIEAVKSWHTEKSYKIMDISGERLYTALEESTHCGRCCLGTCHPWKFHVVDTNHREVLKIVRPCRSTSCCFPCCLQKLKVKADGRLMGTIIQNWNPWRPSYQILDSEETPILAIRGPVSLACTNEVEFQINSLIDQKPRVGIITKKWSGLARNFFQDGNSFALCFPLDLDVKIKAVLLGASILMDFVYFEEKTNLKRLDVQHV